MNTRVSNQGSASATATKKRSRSLPLSARMTRFFYASAGRLAPETTARQVFRMVFTPRRTKPNEAALGVVAKAQTSQSTVHGDSIYHYRWGDTGPCVLLVHGWSGDVGQMAAFVEPLRAAGCQVVALDLPGHGQSSGREVSVNHFEDAIADAVATFGPFDGVIAHSLGASAVAYGMTRGFECKRAVFISPASAYGSIWKKWEMGLNLPPTVMPIVISRAEERFGVRFDAMEPLQFADSMTTPLLIVHDRRDRECSFKDAAKLAEIWPGAELIATETLGHTRILRDPEIVRQVVAKVCEPVAGGSDHG